MDELIGLKLKDIADGRVTKGFIFEKVDGTLTGFRVPKDKIEEVDFSKKEEDNWNLTDNGESQFCAGSVEHNKTNSDIKTFIQKVKEDDDKSAEFIKNSKSIENHPYEYKRGYYRAMHDTNLHRDKRAGDLK